MNAPHMSVQPAVPLHVGRRQHDVHYATSSPLPHLPPMYNGYQHHYSHGPPPHYPQPPQQWYQYQQMSMPMLRPYHHYPSMMNAPYPIHNTPAPMQPRPRPPQHAPSSSSIQSRQDVLSPSSSSASLNVPTSSPAAISNPYLAPPTPPPPSSHFPFYPPLPWYSFTEGTFPPRGPRRRRKRPAPRLSSAPVEFPFRENPSIPSQPTPESDSSASQSTVQHERVTPTPYSTSDTPVTSHAPSESESTQPTTPCSTMTPAPPRSQNDTNKKGGHKSNASNVPIIPAIPNILLPSRPKKQTATSVISDSAQPSNAEHLTNAVQAAAHIRPDGSLSNGDQVAAVSSSPIKTAPRSWADLVRSKTTQAETTAASPLDGAVALQTGLPQPKGGSLADALRSYSITSDDTKISFLEPRGLVNTGNMCYMNSVLQILVFCIPFYDFLGKTSKIAAHSFKSETPLVDAMIMFMREFTIIDSAVTVEKLRMRLKEGELEQYGEAFIPEFVYEVIRRLPRFSSMRRGHQQDAEEFLGFLLEEMHDECGRVMRASASSASSGASTPTIGFKSQVSDSAEVTIPSDNGWLEVGPKQRAAITRASGMIINESPVTKIFGGKLRSELRVPGMKNSVTLEPYQPLQLDIGSPHVGNIVDALKGLTRSETLHGDFNSPRGPGATATKQVFIETLPQVLILHLKRFQYDNAGGTQKIWKRIGYPLELEIPKEVFPQHRRGSILIHGGLPKYRLIGVVYHHGKNASGGHYTVDVRRQDGREWIRLDDTIIRRVCSEDVVEGGSGEDSTSSATALQTQKNNQTSSGNSYDQIAHENEEQAETEKGWSHVNCVNSATSTTTTTNKKWSGVANGISPSVDSSGHRTPNGRSSARDNKVAYLLFYEKLGN